VDRSTILARRQATIPPARRWSAVTFAATNAMTARQKRLLELIDLIHALLEELKQAIRDGEIAGLDEAKAVQAFADETLRDRDA
jgi:hypothetical protein